MDKQACLKINGQEDRRTIASILADNGHEVLIDSIKEGFDINYWVCINLASDKSKLI